MKGFLTAALLLLLLPVTAAAQDFRKVVEIVDEMETSLKRIIAKEEADRKDEIANLRKEIAALRQNLSVGASNADTSQLTNQLTALVAELKKVMREMPPAPPAQPKQVDAPPASGKIKYTVSGQIRDRGELDGRAFAPGARALGYNLLRSRLNVGLKPAEDVEAQIQVQDSRFWGGENSTLARGTQDATAKAMDFHQAYLAVSNLFSTGLGLKIGRQEMLYGNERLISVSNWNNSGRSFDAAKATYDDDLCSVHLFTAKLVASQTATPSENLHGLYATVRHLKPVLADLVCLIDNNTTELTKGPDAGENTLSRITAGMRLFGKPVPFDFDLEFFHQFGRIALTQTKVRSTIKAYLFSINGGLTLDAAHKLRVGVLCTAMTGDNNPEDGSYGVFTMIFGSGHTFFGYMDLFPKVLGDYGIHDAALSCSVTPVPTLALALDLHSFSLDKAVSVQGAGGALTGIKQLGQELDLTANYKYSSALTFTLGLSAFVPDEAMRFARGPATSYWGFLASTVSFE